MSKLIIKVKFGFMRKLLLKMIEAVKESLQFILTVIINLSLQNSLNYIRY
jgi:hypothetical protein